MSNKNKEKNDEKKYFQAYLSISKWGVMKKHY